MTKFTNCKKIFGSYFVVLLKSDLDVQQAILGPRNQFFEHLSQTKAAPQSVTRLEALIAMNLDTLQAVPKRYLLFNKPEVCLLNI